MPRYSRSSTKPPPGMRRYTTRMLSWSRPSTVFRYGAVQDPVELLLQTQAKLVETQGFVHVPDRDPAMEEPGDRRHDTPSAADAALPGQDMAQRRGRCGRATLLVSTVNTDRRGRTPGRGPGGRQRERRVTAPTTLGFGVNLNNREPLIAPGYGIPQLLDLSETVEGLGFDSVWVGDSLFSKPRYESMALLSALSQRTKRVKLGTACIVTSPRNPLYLALEWATLDVLSGGRTIFGPCAGQPGAGRTTRVRGTRTRLRQALLHLRGRPGGRPPAVDRRHGHPPRRPSTTTRTSRSTRAPRWGR